MRRILLSLVLALAVAFPATAIGSSDVAIGLNISIGNQPRVVAVPPPAAVYASYPVVIEEPPVFIVPPALGFHVAVGIPHDLFFISNTYYLYRGKRWYAGPYYNGPWVVIPYSKVPHRIHKYKYEKIRYIREQEYRIYRHDRDHYHSRHFRPDKHYLKEVRKEDSGRRKNESKHRKHD